MNDFEIDEVRRVRHQISAENAHDLQKIAEYYRRIEKELRESGRVPFAGAPDRKTLLRPLPETR